MSNPPFPQRTKLQARKNFSFKYRLAGNMRMARVIAGERFWVSNTTVDQAASKTVKIHREGAGHSTTGYPFTANQILELFEIAM